MSQPNQTKERQTKVATTTTPDARRMDDVIDAMRTVQTESDRWTLAESLRTLIPKGTEGFDKIIDEATQAGVAGTLKAHTLRLYRDTAARWPKSSRIPGVSFSAHREAMVMIAGDGNTKRAEKLLNDLAKKGGPDKVTVASVRRAAAIQQGKTPPAGRGSGTTAAPTTTRGMDVLNDLENGAPQLLTALGTVDTDKLDKLHAGLSKALQRVEQLRAKAQRASAKAKTAPAKPAAKPTAQNGAKKPAAKRTGDLRDL